MSGKTDSSVLDAAALQLQLDEKNQLVEALTERLEEAAEQLDRIHRTGGDKGGRAGGGGGMSAEAHAQQQKLIDEVTKSVELWDGLQPRDAFERIEMRLDDLRDMLEGAVVSQPGEGGREKKQSDSLSAWEKMKAQLIEDDAAAPTEEHGSTAADSASTAKATPSTPSKPDAAPPSTPDTEPLPPLSDLELPEPVDVNTAVRSDLVDAIESRDQFIGYLTRRLRSAESRTHQSIDWAALNNAPEDLRKSLQRLEAELEDRLRIAEVDLSLERARLSRVETRIRGMQQQIEKRLEAAGHPNSPKQQAASPPKKEQPAKGWFGSRKK